ncbi:MAG: NAD(P)-dependent oxidoreductase [Gammaproteobacteria bacterium]|nr:NAD(P)-dependent oxidoreductase [Gammaproteobacteria bacterium]
MHVLLTGATGWIGQHLACQLHARGFHITAVARRTESFEPLASSWPKEIERVAADLAGDLSALPSQVDAVVHVAGQSLASGMPAWLSVRDNLVATHHLLNYALYAGAQRFIFTSSLSVYGAITEPVVDEATPCVDPGSYGLSKLLAERLLADESDTMPVLALRLPGVLGTGASQPWVARMLQQMLAGETIAIFNPDSLFNNAVYIDDLGDFIAGVLTQPLLTGFDVVTLGAKGTVLVREVPAIMAAAIGFHQSVCYIAASRSSFIVSSEHAITRYGYAPRHITDILRHFACEYQASPQQNIF